MGVDLSIVWEGMTHALTFQNLLWLCIGATLGLIAGTLPGLGSGSMMAILLPIVVTLPVDTMLIALAGIYAANIYADSTTGILYNIPGHAAGIPATIEGYRLNVNGRLEEAFSAQVSGALFGSTVGFLLLVLLVPTLIYFVKFFGSGERALLSIWALVFISSGSVTREKPLQSFLSVGIGLALALIGQQPNVGTFRFTLGFEGLWDGIKVVVLVLGLFAVPQLLSMIKLVGGMTGAGSVKVDSIRFFSLYRSMGRTLWEGRGVVTRTSLVGATIGMIPGIGPSTASWVGYSIARAKSRLPEKFGEGNRDGVLGPESAGNACEVGTIVPLLALGIPGSAAAAVMLGALNMVGIYPGPSMYASYGVQVWTVMFGIGLSGVMFAILAFPFIRAAQFLGRAPVSVLIGAIGTLCMMGAFIQTSDLFGIEEMLAIGLGTVLLTQIGLRPAPTLIGFVLGPGIEKELIRAYQIRGVSRFLEGPSLAILAIIALTLGIAIYRGVHRRRAAAALRSDDTEDAGLPEAGHTKDNDLALGGLGVLLAACLLGFSVPYPPLATLWIYVVATGFIAIPALLLLRMGWAERAKRMGAAALRSKLDKGLLLKRAAVFGFFLLFLAMIDYLGFVLATVVFVFGLATYFDRKPVRALVFAAIIAAFIWSMKTGFGFYLPIGDFGI